jgi:hypothetical protein
MKIKYLGNFGNPFSDSTEEHIKYAFEQLGHEVVVFNEKEFDMQAIIDEPADLFLFHKGGQNTGVELPHLMELLNKITCPKIFWYFDKIDRGQRETWLRAILPFVDWGFITDGGWIRRNNYANISQVMQGVGNEDMKLGKFNEKYAHDVVFLGSIYGDRINFIEGLKAVYGDRFKLYNNIFGRELYDLCATVKVIVAPRSIQNDFYWSSRVYMMLGSGGFLIHPKLEGMKKEFNDGEHIVYYLNGLDFKEKIDYYLEHEGERKKIQKAGYELVISKYTYQHRVEEILKKLKDEGILKTNK